VHVEAGVGERRRHVAGRAGALTVEDRLAALRGRRVEAALRRRGAFSESGVLGAIGAPLRVGATEHDPVRRDCRITLVEIASAS
jgi:hypothetical protein